MARSAVLQLQQRPPRHSCACPLVTCAQVLRLLRFNGLAIPQPEKLTPLQECSAVLAYLQVTARGVAAVATVSLFRAASLLLSGMLGAAISAAHLPVAMPLGTPRLCQPS